VTLDLTGLPPTPGEVRRFLADTRPNAYERLVERLLASPHYGERWGRHWLDVARWADSEGYEYNFLRPDAWRYRDYVVRSFNADKPFDRFVTEQIAGDELLPYRDENLIATGFLAAARYSSNEEDKAMQRNDVLVDITNATASAFLGLTMACAQCHDHKFDPITQRDYYRLHGFFVQGQMNNLVLKDPRLHRQYEASISEAYTTAEKLRRSIYEEAHARRVAEARQALPAETRLALETPEKRRTPRQRDLAKHAEAGLRFSTAEVEKSITGEDRKLYDALKTKIDALARSLPRKPQTIGFYSPVTSPTPVEVLQMEALYPLPYDPETLRTTRPRLLIRGDVHQPGPELDAGWPAVFGPTLRATKDDQRPATNDQRPTTNSPSQERERRDPRAGAPRPPSGSRGSTDRPATRSDAGRPRTALAAWLVSPSNPLTARVWANRIWQYHFGRGIVATPGDFGVRGARPSHPELLDWLASELIRSKWSTKHLHRLIVHSATYRQASRPHAGNARIDPQNVYLWRWQPRRLEAEAIRDAMLSVSGELLPTIGGPGVALVKDKFANEIPEENGTPLRRSLYLEQRRDMFPRMQMLFDGPTANESCPRRHVSTVPLQPLFLLNSPFVLERARAFARRVAARAGPDPDRQGEEERLLALGRPPEPAERDAVREMLDAPSGLVHLCHLIFNLNEFVYLE
jgi:hypothetical protein